jgi:hypothetical protein
MIFPTNSRNYDACLKLLPCEPIDDDFIADLWVFSVEMDRCNSVLDRLKIEMWPTSATSDPQYGLLPGFEDQYAIIQDGSKSDVDRRKEVLLRMQYRAGINSAFYYSLASTLGYSYQYAVGAIPPLINIADGVYPEFHCGPPPPASNPGSTLPASVTTGAGQAYVWRVYGTSVSTDVLMQKIFNELKPGGTVVQFIDL